MEVLQLLKFKDIDCNIFLVYGNNIGWIIGKFFKKENFINFLNVLNYSEVLRNEYMIVCLCDDLFFQNVQIILYCLFFLVFLFVIFLVIVQEYNVVY